MLNLRLRSPALCYDLHLNKQNTFACRKLFSFLSVNGNLHKAKCRHAFGGTATFAFIYCFPLSKLLHTVGGDSRSGSLFKTGKGRGSGNGKREKANLNWNLVNLQTAFAGCLHARIKSTPLALAPVATRRVPLMLLPCLSCCPSHCTSCPAYDWMCHSDRRHCDIAQWNLELGNRCALSVTRPSELLTTVTVPLNSLTALDVSQLTSPNTWLKFLSCGKRGIQSKVISQSLWSIEEKHDVLCPFRVSSAL